MRVPRHHYISREDRRHGTSDHSDQKIKRKNFLPTLIFTVVLWIILGGVVYFVDPNTFLAVPLFFLLTFTLLLFTFSLLFAGSRRGLITSISLSSFLVLSYLGVGNIINFLLIVAIAVCVEIYLAQK
jgi:hypothetical protein